MMNLKQGRTSISCQLHKFALLEVLCLYRLDFTENSRRVTEYCQQASSVVRERVEIQREGLTSHEIKSL